MGRSSNSSDFHNQKSFRIKADDDKFLNRVFSKESSISYSSFRVYYGGVQSTVPFTWESRPGTPKHAIFSDNYSNIPPLTPPPSHYNNLLNLTNNPSKISRSRSKIKFFSNLLRRINSKKSTSTQVSVFEAAVPSHNRSYSSSFSSSSSSLYSSFSDHPMSGSTPSYAGRTRRRFSSWGSSFDNKVWSSRMTGEDISGTETPVKGGYSSLKKVLLSIVGRGSA